MNSTTDGPDHPDGIGEPPEPPGAQPLLYTAEQASARLGGVKSAYWLRIKARHRAIPCTFIGRDVCWTEQDLLDLVEQFRVRPRSQGRRR